MAENQLGAAGAIGAAASPVLGDTTQELAEVRRAREGGLDSFETLYRRHVDRVHGLCLRLAGDPDRAEDLTQEVFLRAWRKLGSFHGQSAFGTWLHRLAVNTIISALRRHKSRDEHPFDPEDNTEYRTPATRGDPLSRIDLERAVAALPPGARQTFVLYELEGYSHEEVSELTGLAPGTSRAQLFRARKLLRKAVLP